MPLSLRPPPGGRSRRVQRNLQDLPGSIRAAAYLLERMFPRFREQLGTALDLIVEFSTLGEYRLGADGASVAAGAPAEAPDHLPQLGGAGPRAARAADRRTVAEGPAGAPPVASPAARRPACEASSTPSRPSRSAAREQLCFGL